MVEQARRQGSLCRSNSSLYHHAIKVLHSPRNRRYRGAQPFAGANRRDSQPIYCCCRIRDAAYTLYALMGCGFLDEAKAWRDWLLRAVAGKPDRLQIMYGIAGERRLTEFELAELSGYEASRPVRIGNAASGQLQLDVYGELLDSAYLARHKGLRQNEAGWEMGRALVNHLEQIWTEPDAGIWRSAAATPFVHCQGDGVGSSTARFVWCKSLESMIITSTAMGQGTQAKSMMKRPSNVAWFGRELNSSRSWKAKSLMPAYCYCALWISLPARRRPHPRHSGRDREALDARWSGRTLQHQKLGGRPGGERRSLSRL